MIFILMEISHLKEVIEQKLIFIKLVKQIIPDLIQKNNLMGLVGQILKICT